MKNELVEIVNRFQGKKIAVFGDVMIDKYVYGTVSRISPESPPEEPIPIVDEEFIYYFPGGAGNAANNIASLGGTPLLVGVVGDDYNKKRLYDIMKDFGIKPRYLVTDKSRPTTRKRRTIGIYKEDGKQKQFVRVDREKKDPISKEIEDKILKSAKKIIKSADAVILSDYGKGLLTERVCKELISLCKIYKKITIVDPKANFSKYKGATIITPNKKEFMKYSDNSDALKVIENNELEALLITKGKDGMTLYEKNIKNPFNIDAIEIKTGIEDVTGAGDTVVGTLALALSTGAGMKEVAKLANVAAGLVVGKEGTATITMYELIKELGGMNAK